MMYAVSEGITAIAHRMELVVRDLPKITLKQKVDLGAQIRSLLKLCEAVDGSIKDDIKAKLHDADGVVNGYVFKAVLAYHPEQRVDINALREKNPRIYNKYLKASDVGVIRYEAR